MSKSELLKELSQEFADRKGYVVKVKSHISDGFTTANFFKDGSDEPLVEFTLSKVGAFCIFTPNEASATRDTDQFKKRIEEL